MAAALPEDGLSAFSAAAASSGPGDRDGLPEIAALILIKDCAPVHLAPSRVSLWVRGMLGILPGRGFCRYADAIVTCAE